jgi:DNA (cytosine-5)-methyltransferase 1
MAHLNPAPLRSLHLFAGAGGGILGDLLLGHVPVCAVELEAYPRNVLLQRQRDGLLPWFPIWDDVRTFDGNPWRGRVDIVAGGFPCQDISAAGKGAGIEGQRSGLWSEFARIIGEVRPRFVFVENSPMLVGRGLGRVLGDLASLGFDAEWCVLGADNAGAPHVRKRIWILAHARSGWGQDNELCPGRDFAGVRYEELAHPAGLGRIEGWPEPEGQQGRPDALGGGPQIPNPMRPRLPKRKQEALLPAGGGQERGTTRELHRALSNAPSRVQQRWRNRIRRWLECQASSGEGPRGGRSQGPSWWATEPALGRAPDGLAPRVDEH